MSHELYWIAGSPFAWRTLLGLTVKGVNFESRLLEASKGEHRSEAYLALNPRGKVPLLANDETAVYESVATLAYLEQKHPEPALFGRTSAETGRIWQAVLEIENYLRDPILGVALPIYRGTAAESVDEVKANAKAVHVELTRIDSKLRATDYLAGDTLSAADIVLYPFTRSLRRATQKPEAEALALGFDAFERDYPAIDAWMTRVESIPGFDNTVPPNWRE